MSAHDELAARVAKWSGLDVADRGPALRGMLEARVAALGLPTAERFLELVTSAHHVEAARLINALTVSFTWFFRDAEQLAAIAQRIAVAPRHRPVAIWIAGCATGEDAWAVAMLAARADRAVSVLATDINTDVLEQARLGCYAPISARHVPADMRHHLVVRPDGQHEVTPALRASVRFAQHNLLDAPPPSASQGFDVILCRNVLIHFQRDRRRETVARLCSALAVGGRAFFGASEIFEGVPAGVLLDTQAGVTALRRADASARAITPPAPAPAVMPQRPMPPPQPSEDARLAAASAELDAGRYPRALELYSEILASNPLSTEARLGSGIAHHLAGDPATAVQLLRSALCLDPLLGLAVFYLAMSYEKLGRTNDARREYRRLVEEQASFFSRSDGLRDRVGALSEEILVVARQRM